MCAFGGEPRLEDLMSDPIVQAVMKADGVDESHLRRILPQAVRKKQRPVAPRRRVSSAVG